MQALPGPPFGARPDAAGRTTQFGAERKGGAVVDIPGIRLEASVVADEFAAVN